MPLRVSGVPNALIFMCNEAFEDAKQKTPFVVKGLPSQKEILCLVLKCMMLCRFYVYVVSASKLSFIYHTSSQTMLLRKR